jgi:hypothetical protein
MTHDVIYKHSLQINMESTDGGFKQLTTSQLIDAYQNEAVLWNTDRCASEEKELATLFKTCPYE